MKFGLSLSGLLQHSRDADMVQRFTDVLHLVRVARDLEFNYIYAGQHYLSHPYQMLQPLASLARISAEAGGMEMLSTILVPLQNPVQMAEDVATLDVLTNGRMTEKSTRFSRSSVIDIDAMIASNFFASSAGIIPSQSCSTSSHSRASAGRLREAAQTSVGTVTSSLRQVPPNLGIARRRGVRCRAVKRA